MASSYDDETLESILLDVIPQALASLDERTLRDAIEDIENSVGMNTLSAIDLSARRGRENLTASQTCARALLVSLGIFQSCLIAYRSQFQNDDEPFGTLH